MLHDAGVCRVRRAKTRLRTIRKIFARRGNHALFLAFPLIVAGCAHLPSQPRGQPSYWGFTGPWDRRSDSSVVEHGSSLAQIITGWIALDTTSFRPVLLYPDSIGNLPAVAPRKTALITSYFGSRFHPEIIRGIGGSAQVSAITAGAIAALVDSGEYRSVVVDFEGMTPRDLTQLLTFTRAVADSVRAHGVSTVVIAVPAGDTAAYPAPLLLQPADLIMAGTRCGCWGGSTHWPNLPPPCGMWQPWSRLGPRGAARVLSAVPLCAD